MRLICPNCGAQYEVADDVIPQTGRDVQCSNCGHTWFEKPGASLAEDVPEDSHYDEPAPDTSDDLAEEEVEDVAEPDFEPEPLPEPEPERARDHLAQSVRAMLDQAEDPRERDEPPAAPRIDDTPPPPIQRQALDASVAEILREEAAREEAARQAEVAGLETQSDLDLPDPQMRRDAHGTDDGTHARIARLKGEDVAAASAASAVGSRREMLPDIEEINSTLRPETEREGHEPEPEEEAAERRRGFRFGFFTVLIVIAILWAIYLFADDLAAAVPALETALAAYVDAVDRLRIWIDLRLQDLLAMLQPEEAGPATATE